MNVEIGAEAALFPEEEYINGIFVTVHGKISSCYTLGLYLRAQGYDMSEEHGNAADYANVIPICTCKTGLYLLSYETCLLHV
jgi:hypothetical protein